MPSRSAPDPGAQTSLQACTARLFVVLEDAREALNEDERRAFFSWIALEKILYEAVECLIEEVGLTGDDG